MNFLSRCCAYFSVLSVFFFPAEFLHAQVTYTVTGFTSELSDHIPEVGRGESYIAEFEIDLSTPDSNPEDPNRGSYESAILSSSIMFSGGYVSQVDFAGGDILILPDNGGGGIFLMAPDDLGDFLIADVGESFDSDALFSDISDQFFGDPTGEVLSLAILQEPNGSISSTSSAPDLGLGTPTRGPILLQVTGSAPVLLGDVNLDGAATFADIPAFIALLSSGAFQPEADCNQDGSVGFFDIPAFVEAISSQP